MSDSRKRPLYPETEQLMDCLPYVDTVDEKYEAYALSLVQEEMKLSKPPKLPPLPPIRKRTSTILETEYKTLSENPDRSPLPLDDLTSHRKKLSKEQVTKIEYENERQRHMILELEKSSIAADQWKSYISNVLEPLQKSITLDAAKQKMAVETIHAERQEYQTKDVGPGLQQLQGKYDGLIQKRVQLARAMAELEQQVEELREEVGSGK